MKKYSLWLNENQIGTTELEFADAPMGVVFGKIIFSGPEFGYDFFKNYCLSNNIEILTDYPEDRLIMANIPDLKVINENAINIEGQWTTIDGMDTDSFTINIGQIAYPFFQDEFPHHVAAYNDQFKN